MRIKASTTGRQAAERERGWAGERRIQRGGDSRGKKNPKKPIIKRHRVLPLCCSWRKPAAVSITVQLSRLVPSTPTENEAAPVSVCNKHWCHTLCTMQTMWGAALFFFFFHESPESPIGIVLLWISQSLNTQAQLHSKTCTGPAGDKAERCVRRMDSVDLHMKQKPAGVDKTNRPQFRKKLISNTLGVTHWYNHPQHTCPTSNLFRSGCKPHIQNKYKNLVCFSPLVNNNYNKKTWYLFIFT